MIGLMTDGFSRYLRAKKSVDDRSLNRWVYARLIEGLGIGKQALPLNIVEVGCGIGTMVERLWDWGLVPQATYTAIDRDLLMRPGQDSRSLPAAVTWVFQKRKDRSG